ncbi:MAG TPA: transporter substrate-binding domain-containing protein [Deinococcales bacterium]|nr:transporter substrate-binding domain-containing protein [Deinococcales bacterium]
MKRVLSIGILGLAFGLSLTSAANQDALLSAKQAGVLRIGQEGTYAPFTYKDASGKLVGFDVDIATEVATRLHLKPQFVLTEWSGIIAGLQAGKYDLIVNQVGVTKERQKSLDFSTPYAMSSAAIIERPDENFKSLADLVGKKVGVGLGSNYEQIARSQAGVNVVTYPGSPEYLADLAAKRIDAALNDRLMASYLIKEQNVPVKVGPTVGAAQPIAIAMRKANPLLRAAVNKALKDMTADGTYAKISVKWFGMDISKGETASK